MSTRSEPFAALTGRHRPRICSIALSVTGSVAGAEDVTQEVLVKLWKASPELEGVALERWLRKTTRNAARDWLRRHTRRARWQELAAEYDLQQRTHETPFEALSKEEQRRLLDGLLAELGEEERFLLALTYQEGRSATEVGEVMGISSASVRKRLERLRARLRQRYPVAVLALLAQLPTDARAATVPRLVAALSVAAVLSAGWSVAPRESEGAMVSATTVAQLPQSLPAHAPHEEKKPAELERIRMVLSLGAPISRRPLGAIHVPVPPPPGDEALQQRWQAFADAESGPVQEELGWQWLDAATKAGMLELPEDPASNPSRSVESLIAHSSAVALEELYGDGLGAGQREAYHQLALDVLEALRPTEHWDLAAAQVLWAPYRDQDMALAREVLERGTHPHALSSAAALLTKLDLSVRDRRLVASAAGSIEQANTRLEVLLSLWSAAWRAGDLHEADAVWADVLQAEERVCADAPNPTCAVARERLPELQAYTERTAPATTWQAGLHKVAYACWEEIPGRARLDFPGLIGQGAWDGSAWRWTEWVPRFEEALITCIENRPVDGPPPPEGTRLEWELNP